MTLFHGETIDSAAATAYAVVEVMRRVVRIMKAEGMQQGTLGATLTQLRALAFLQSSPGASLSELAEDLGLQKPTASKVVEELVQRGRAVREDVPGNRRKLALRVTPAGREALDASTVPTVARVTELLAGLTTEERDTVARAMSILHPLMQPRSQPRSAPGAKTDAA